LQFLNSLTLIHNGPETTITEFFQLASCGYKIQRELQVSRVLVGPLLQPGGVHSVEMKRKWSKPPGLADPIPSATDVTVTFEYSTEGQAAVTREFGKLYDASATTQHAPCVTVSSGAIKGLAFTYKLRPRFSNYQLASVRPTDWAPQFLGQAEGIVDGYVDISPLLQARTEEEDAGEAAGDAVAFTAASFLGLVSFPVMQRRRHL
jgi:hypothetical protein